MSKMREKQAKTSKNRENYKQTNVEIFLKNLFLKLQKKKETLL